jgi:AraC family transcriptional regulator
MEWIERLNEAINYMEEHMTEEIDYEQVAKIACCSSYHFQRMFAYLANVPLSEYIRRRRMSLAVADLQRGEEKIIEIAMKYGYASPTAFNRSFQSVHGMAPSIVKQDGVSLKSFPPISFKITVKGVEEMNFRIERRDAFRIVGVAEPLYRECEKNYEIVPLMWQKATENGTVQKLVAMIDGQPAGLLGVCACNDTEEWRYFISVASTQEMGPARCRNWDSALCPSGFPLPAMSMIRGLILKSIYRRTLKTLNSRYGYRLQGGLTRKNL